MSKRRYPPFHPRAGQPPMVMSLAEFQSMFSGESDYVERKTGTGIKPLQRAIVAFSNSDGGVLLLGVADDGSVLGRAATQGVSAAIHEESRLHPRSGSPWPTSRSSSSSSLSEAP